MDDEQSPIMDQVKRLINEYCQKEFQSDSDFSDLSNVGLAFTTTEDERHTIQINVNLIDWCIDCFVDDKRVEQRVYPSLQDLIDAELEYLDFVELIDVPIPEEEAEGGNPAPAYDLGFGHMGNGLVWNRLRTVHGDYQTVAHIAPDRSVTIYDTDMPDEVRQQIYDVAATSDARVSATQDIPVFSTPPQVRELATSETPAEKKTEAPAVPEESEQVDAIPAPRPRRERVTFTTLHPEIPADQRHNFRITDPELGYGTPSEKYAANVAAIRTLKHIEAEERLATPEEQEVLSRYVGWGGRRIASTSATASTRN